MTVYYNEYDPQAAAWLRELIKAGLIAPGKVDERSIADVKADDLRGFSQCHFFAGIGGWNYALRLAGWPDDRPVWTGSCPCQSFSTAGKQAGVNDPRHLWPVWFKLIKACKPQFIFGEQVAAAINHGWLDLIQADLASEGYSSGGAVLGAHSVGAPHIRQRLYFGAHRVAESDSTRREQGQRHDQTAGHRDTLAAESGDDRPRPTDAPESIWSNPDWLFCRDGKWRPVESSVQRVVDGLSDELVCGCNIRSASYPLAKDQEARTMRLKGYGNAIVPPLAAEAIRAYMESKQ